MALMNPNMLRYILKAHGLRPYDVIVEFLPDQPSSVFDELAAILTGTGKGWKERPVTSQSVKIGYGAQNYSFTFEAPDPESVSAEHIPNPQSTLKVPKNGEWICVTVLDSSTNMKGRVIFRGMVRSVHARILDAGKIYSCEAISDVFRLNAVNVTFNVNFRNDPVNPSPRFDNLGNLQTVTQLKTVYQIAQDIMNFRDTWNTQEYFQFSDIDWNGLDNDPRLGLYVPPTLSFQDTPKGKALEDLISRAGNFTFVFVPSRDGRGTLKIVELNLVCNRCGDIWDIQYAPTTTLAQLTQSNYAYNFILGEDDTAWETMESANVIRLTTSQIRFYSGNWIIPEVIEGQLDTNSNPIDPYKNCLQIENDTVDAQKKRCVSLDNVNYRFTYSTDNVQDIRTNKIYPVGMPLYPDWNVHEDYLPAFLEIQDVLIPPSGAATTADATPVVMTADKYRGLVEYQTYTIGDEICRGTTRVRYVNNLRVYQAWYSDQPCPACTPTPWPSGAPGLGLVQKVYDNAENEPVIQWYFVDPSGNRRDAGDTDLPKPGERMSYTVTNYLFPPNRFGNASGMLFGLVPWADSANSYPLPWKNLCPYCRGTGMNPMWKIRNMHPDLFAGRNNQINQPSGVSEIPVDADFTQVGPETWEETQSRLSMHESAWLAVETPILKPQIPIFPNRNQTFPSISALVPADDQTNQFANPLTFVNLTKRLPILFGAAPTSDDAKIVPDSWTCEVPFTTINFGAKAVIDYQMGRVKFDEPQVIYCRKQFTQYVLYNGQTLLVNSSGWLQPKNVGRGQRMADRNNNPTGFWRAAKAWLQFYFIRDMHYEYMFDQPTTSFTALTADGEAGQYQSRTAIHDGKLVIEVIRVNPNQNETGGTEFQTGNMILQKAMTDYDSRVETTVNDLYKMPTGSLINATPADFETYKRAQGLDFPRARMFKMEVTTTGEIEAEMEGYIAADYASSITRPKLFSWRLWDDRSKLLAKAIRELELSNQIIVSGTMRVVGVSHDLTNGLGYIDKPDQGKAVVISVEYNFGDGMQAELCISREQARFGEPVPKEADLLQDVQKSVIRQGRVIDLLEATQSAQSNQASPQSDINDVSSSAGGIYRGS